jgi:ABC-type sugar transport system permease subunit
MNKLKQFGKKIVEYLSYIPTYYFLLMEYIIIGIVKGWNLFIKYVWNWLIKHLFGPVKRWLVKAFTWLGQKLSKLFDVKGLRVIKRSVVKQKSRYLSKRTMAKKRATAGHMFVLPWTIGFLGLVVYPFGRIVYMSFNNVFSQQQDYVYNFVGWENYRRILMDDIDFVLEVQNFVVRVLLYTPVIITLAIIIALLLNQDIKGKGIFRMIFFLPIIILNGALLENMSNYGGTDIQISFFILDVITTVVPRFAVALFIEMFGYIVEILWYTGVPILIFLAMLQKIDRSLYEAASIDGANAWSIFWKVTLPIIRPAITVSIIFIVVFLANFDGNPINGIIDAARSRGDRREGYASALAILYSIVQILVISILYFVARQRPQKGRA